MAVISWLDKIDGDDLGNPRMNVNASDMNDIKNTVNDNTAASFIASFFVFDETPGGAVNSSNVAYTISVTPVSGTERLFRNGLRQKRTVDYTISGANITMSTAPETGDILLIDYMKTPA